MTLNQLSYFYQAAVLEHFNQAAEKMNITEPSLSRSIAALEDELGVTLFEKRGRNVILTKAGEIFLEHVSTILDDVKRAENKMHQIATDGGHIDIAYVSPLAKVFIPTIVRSFLTEKENKKPHSAAGKSKYQTHRLKYARTPATSSGNKQHRIWELILACPDNTPPQTSYNPVTGIFIQVKHPIQAPTVKLPKSATIQSCIEVTWKL